MKKALLKSLIAADVEHTKVVGRKAEPLIDTSVKETILARTDLALEEQNGELKFILLYEIYQYYKGEPYFTSIFKGAFEGALFKKGLLAKFTEYVNHVQVSDYLRTLRDIWTTYPQKVKPAALLEAFKLHFMRSPADVAEFKKTFTVTDRKLLGLL